MLNMVGNPYAINPTKELIGHILKDDELRSKINVIVERKDVTYQLNVESLLLID